MPPLFFVSTMCRRSGSVKNSLHWLAHPCFTASNLVVRLLSNLPMLAFLLLASLASFAQASSPGSNDGKLVVEFQQRARQYLDWREKTAGKPPAPTDSPEKIVAARRELANKVRVARAGAPQGQIFTSEVAGYFRRQIAITLNGRNGKQVLTSLRHAEPTSMQLQINESYPEKVPLQSTPPTLLMNLPELPKGLEYRILGRELVLRDSDANIVVDYVPNALPGTSK